MKVSITTIDNKQVFKLDPLSSGAIKVIESAQNISNDADDAQKQAQEIIEFTDSKGTLYEKGAKGYRDESITLKDQAITAKNLSEIAKNESVTAKDNALQFKSDAEKHAQNTTQFTDSNNVVFSKGAKGYSADAEQALSDLQDTIITSASIVGDDIVFTKQGGETVTLTGAASDLIGADGDNGWTPVFAVVDDGARRVLQVLDWTGGEGSKPAVGQYVGATGLVALIADAIDIRGEGLGTHETSVGNHTDVDLTGAQDGDLLQRESGIWVKKNKVDSLSRLFANYPQQRQVAWDTFNRPNGALGTSDSGHAYTVNAGNPEILDKIARMTNEADVHIHVPHLASIINGTTRKRVVDATISAFSVSSISVGLWMGVDKDNRIEAYSTQSTLEIKKVINGVRSTVSTISTNSNDVRYSFGRITFNLHVIGFRETMRAFLIDRDRGVTLGNVVLDEHFALFSDFPLIGFIGTTSSASNTPVANFNAYDLA